MSWFGEQLSSFTGKITDFTKEILPDSGVNPPDDLSSQENISLTPKDLLSLCKEKDGEISSLMNERASLEKSIEELDTQHQEAISELLYLKSEAVKENIALKKELAFHKENASVKSLFQKFEHNYCPRDLNSNGNQFVSKVMLSNSLKSFNLVNIIGILWRNFNENCIKNVLEWLQEQKLLLETLIVNTGDSSSRDVIDRINAYIEFLHIVSTNPKQFSHIIDEIATVIHFFFSNVGIENTHFSVPESINGQSPANSSSGVESGSIDFSSQTCIPDFELVRNLFSETPIPYLCTSPLAVNSDYETSSLSQHVQTDNEHSSQNCKSLIFELQQYIVHIEHENNELQNRVLELEEQASDLQEQLSASVSTSSVFVQTESIQNEISNSNSDTSLKSSVVQTDKFDCDCNNPKLKELQAYINVLEQEKIDFQHKFQELYSAINTSTTSSLIQTDEYVCGCNIHELEAGICILEQDKADLEEELSQLKSQIEKPVSSVFIQTEIDSNSCDLLQSEISNLKQILRFHEKESNDTIQELCENLNNMEEELKAKECVICDKENKVQFLEHECVEHRQIIDSLTAEIQGTDDINKLKERLKHNENYIKEKESVIHSLESKLDEYKAVVNNLTVKAQQADDLVSLRDDLETKNSALQDKENAIHLLKHETEKYKSIVNNLQEELHEVGSLNNLKEEIKLKDCIIQEKENKIHSLEKDLEAYNANIETLKMQQVDEIESLKEKLKSKDSEIQDNICIIQSLKKDLQTYESDIDAIKMQQVDEIERFKEKLKSKDYKIEENVSTIQSLEKDVETYKTNIDILFLNLQQVDEIERLKETLKSKDYEIQENVSTIKAMKKDLEAYKADIDTLKIQQVDEMENFKEKLKTKDFEIQENVSTIQSLKDHLEQYKTALDISMETQQTACLVSTDTQTEWECCSLEFHEAEVRELKKSMFEKEKEHNAIENQLMCSINELNMQVNSTEVFISEKESLINSLNFELENSKTQIKNLNGELNQLKESSLSVRDENQFLCNEHESEIEKLKLCITDKEKEFVAVENNLNSCITNLREMLQSKDLLIIDKEETIQTLKLELDEARRNLKKYQNDIKTLKARQDYAKDIDTMEENDITMIMNNCNRCKNSLSGESTDNDLKNEVQVLQDKFKALEMDKNQLLCVLNEKTQECSSLKAEVHKLTNIVASEKQALYKLQQDNCLLKESRENCDPELTKEAIQKLSGIIRDKDLEIESLRQKNFTLTTLFQDTGSIPDHLQSLVEEKENLAKQINVLKADRDKIMARYNAIDKDCRNYAAEVKNLQSALSEQKKQFDVLEQKHFSVAQQYEEKQKSLINTQNEMIALKQRVSDLEQQQFDIKEKYSELLNKFSSDTMVQIAKDELTDKNTQIEKLMTASSEKDHLIQEKDCLIHDLSQQIKTLKLEHGQQQINISNLQVKVEEITAKLKEHEDLVNKHLIEKEALEVRFQDKNSELSLLKDMNERLNMSLKEKEFTIQSMTEKISSLSHFISSDHSSPATLDINQILADSESMFSKAQSLYKERDETLLALSQSKQENQSLRNEIQRMKSNEIHLNKELERLRMHLLEIEENYTTDALKAEEREKELRNELIEMRRRAEISNTAIVDTNQRASIQIASLQEQLSIIANQRDQALTQVSTLEDKVQQHSASVSKLQLVLEQMQRGNERKIRDAERKLIVELEKQKQLHKELEGKLRDKEMQLEESTQALEAASRLSEQLDAKEEMIAHLKNELSKTESKIKSTAREIDTIKSNTEGKVDRVVMKSLVLGYFSTPPGQKSEVIRLLARVLDFNQEEMEKAGIVVGRQAQRGEQRGLFSSIFSRLPSLGSDNTPPPPEKSFTTLFVQFLENESQPIVPMPFPVEKMAQEVSYKQHPNKTPEKKNLSKSNPLLLDIDSAFPTFTPVPAIEYSQSPAPAILREVLE